MNFPKEDLGSNEEHINKKKNQQEDIANTLNDKNAMSTQEHKERFASAPKMLQDTFILQDDGSFLVKMPENSEVMEGHLRDLPIVPGIVLKRLFFHQTGTKAEGIVTTQFIGGAFSGQSIIVKRDGIYTPAGKRIVDIIPNTQEEIPAVQDTRDMYYMDMQENLDDYLLQQNAFRFVDTGDKSIGPMRPDSQFRGQFKIPEDFIRAEDGKIGSEILEEIGAQIGAYVTGPDLNKNISMIQTVEDTTQINPDSKVFTFKLGKSLTTDIHAQAGEMVFVKGRVIAFDPNGKEAHFCYTVRNREHKHLLAGEIKGNIVPIKMLIRAYGQIKNSVQKQ